MQKTSGLPGEYQKLLESALKNISINKKYAERIIKNPPKGLDQTIHLLHERAFAHIDCTRCANCCSSLGPRITDRDIRKMAKSLRMKPSELAEKWLMIDEDGDYIFRTMPCPFLNAEKICNIYGSRPAACAAYPHTDQPRQSRILKLSLKNSVICPAVAQIFEWLREN